MLKDKQEKLNSLATQVRELADKSSDEKFDWTPEHDEQWTRLNGEYDSLKLEIDAELARDERQARANEIAEYSERLSSQERRFVPGLDDTNSGSHETTGSRLDPNATETRVLALQGWMRAGEEKPLTDDQQEACKVLGVRADSKKLELDFNRKSVRGGYQAFYREGKPMLPERRDLGIVSPTKGQETVPEGFVYELEKAMVAFNGPRQVCRLLPTASGNPLPWPTVDDTGNEGEILAENTSIGASVDPTFAQVTFGAYKYSSKPILVAEELLEDSAFNLGVELGALIGERIGRKTAGDFTTGSGTGEPTGIVTASQLGLTAASATAITADEIIDLAHSCDPSYRGMMSAGYMMHDLILAVVRKLKDSQGQYLWQPSLQLGVPDRLYGFPVSVNQQMASATVASAAVALFGAFEKFVIRDAGALRFYRLDERYRDTDQTGFVAFSRHDSNSIQGPAIRHLIMAAS